VRSLSRTLRPAGVTEMSNRLPVGRGVVCVTRCGGVRAVMILLIPVNAVLARYLGGIQKEMMKHKDARNKLVNEVLQGIRVIKFFAWCVCEPSSCCHVCGATIAHASADVDTTHTTHTHTHTHTGRTASATRWVACEMPRCQRCARAPTSGCASTSTSSRSSFSSRELISQSRVGSVVRR
jgi:hypothetical protein